MGVSNLFAKKRDLSDKSNNGDEPQWLWEESSVGSSSSNSPGDVFQESLKYPDCMKTVCRIWKSR